MNCPSFHCSRAVKNLDYGHFSVSFAYQFVGVVLFVCVGFCILGA